MDERPSLTPADPLILTGVGRADAATGPVDPRPHLRSGKARKTMGLQDDLAVVAAGRALAAAGLGADDLGERAGLFFAVGHIPFEEGDLRDLRDGSVVDGRLSMAAFSTTGFTAVNPLLTFRCLPNMPVYHVSACFGIRGPSFVGYPGAGQLFLAFEQAVAALADGEVDVALVGGVAAQRNFLVEHHHRRLLPPVPATEMVDAAAVLVVETAAGARRRGSPVRARLEDLRIDYRPHDPLGDTPGEVASAVAPAAALATALERGEEVLTHRILTKDGLAASWRWRLG